jgi:hypothetical protein
LQRVLAPLGIPDCNLAGYNCHRRLSIPLKLPALSEGLRGFNEVNYSCDDEGSDESRRQVDKNAQPLQAVEIFAKLVIVNYEVSEEEAEGADYRESDNSRAAFGRDEPRRKKTSDERDHQTRGQVCFNIGDDLLKSFCHGFNS